MRVRRLLLSLLLAAVVAAAQIAPPSDAKAQVDDIFGKFARRDSPGCAVGVGIGDNTVLQAAYGMADLEHGVPNTVDTIFEAGSVSKQFVAASLLLLVQRGKVSLDDPVRKYFPEIPEYPGPTMTLRHLMNHTSGLRDWGSVGAIAGKPRFSTVAYTQGDVLEIAARQKSLNYPPGEHYSYTNTGYNLLAILIGRVTGKSLAEFTRTEVFAPLHMASSGWRDDIHRIVPNRAVAYEPLRTGGFRMDMPFETAHGNGGMLTTIGDLLKWNLNFTHHTVGSRSFTDAQVQRARLNNGSTITYAAGLQVQRWRGLSEVSHSGTTAGYNAWLARYPEQGLSIALLCNVQTSPVALGHAVAAVYLKPVLGAPQPSPNTNGNVLYRSTRDGRVAKMSGPKLEGMEGDPEIFERVEPASPTVSDLSQLVGEYTSAEAGTKLIVSVDGNRLVIRQKPELRIPLTPTTVDSFQGSIGSVRFIRNSAGAVTGLSVGSSRVWDMRFRRVVPAK